MLKMFPLPAFIERFARRRIVNVALFGNGLSMMEWPHLCATFWHHHVGFTINIVDDPAEADILAVHGPLTSGSWPFFQRWIDARAPHAKVIVVGSEIATLGGRILEPTGRASAYPADAILPGHPPTPDVLKTSLQALMQGSTHV